MVRLLVQATPRSPKDRRGRVSHHETIIFMSHIHGFLDLPPAQKRDRTNHAAENMTARNPSTSPRLRRGRLRMTDGGRTQENRGFMPGSLSGVRICVNSLLSRPGAKGLFRRKYVFPHLAK